MATASTIQFLCQTKHAWSRSIGSCALKAAKTLLPVPHILGWPVSVGNAPVVGPPWSSKRAVARFASRAPPAAVRSTMPAWALVATLDCIIAIGGRFTVLLTQVKIPALYWRCLDMQPEPVATVVIGMRLPTTAPRLAR